MRGGKRSGAGRKPVAIDLGELEKLCALQCTNEEISAWFGCSVRTIEKFSQKAEVREITNRGRAKGRISVRRAQMKMLDAGNATMGIWMGKQLLGQRDVTPIELSGPSGKPLKLTMEMIDEVLKKTKQN